ncbi:MAG: hypothetical protein U1E05_10850, partial [Patescibacteria group bacterium]|nr:hypothetical protein [Patescibacteria group bacterium]
MKLRCLAPLLLTLTLVPGTGHACDWVAHMHHYGWSRWAADSRYCTGEHIPYFAKHPPVYYSYPIARPYGDSPYASPPMTSVREVVVVRPLVVRNGYVTGDAAPWKANKPAPLRIINPFVHDSGA